MKETLNHNKYKNKFMSKLEKENSKIKEKNKSFSKLGKMQKRVMIARDVIAQVKAKKFKVKTGTYCDLKINKKYKPEVEGELELQSLMESGVVEKCTVCAIGGIFASKVSIGNKFNINVENDSWDDENPDLRIDNELSDDEIFKNLENIYSSEELRKIEYAFEGNDIDDSFWHEEDEFHKNILSYSKVHKNVDNRLIAIMQNIIDNNGKFKPVFVTKK